MSRGNSTPNYGGGGRGHWSNPDGSSSNQDERNQGRYRQNQGRNNRSYNRSNQNDQRYNDWQQNQNSGNSGRSGQNNNNNSGQNNNNARGGGSQNNNRPNNRNDTPRVPNQPTNAGQSQGDSQSQGPQSSNRADLNAPSGGNPSDVPQASGNVPKSDNNAQSIPNSESTNQNTDSQSHSQSHNSNFNVHTNKTGGNKSPPRNINQDNVRPEFEVNTGNCPNAKPSYPNAKPKTPTSSPDASPQHSPNQSKNANRSSDRANESWTQWWKSKIGFGTPATRPDNWDSNNPDGGSKKKSHRKQKNATFGDFVPEHMKSPDLSDIPEETPLRSGNQNQYSPQKLSAHFAREGHDRSNRHQESMKTLREHYEHCNGDSFSNFCFSKPIQHYDCQIVPSVTLWSLMSDFSFSYEEIRIVLACIHDAPLQSYELPQNHVGLCKSLALYDCELNDLCDYKDHSTTRNINYRRQEFLNALGGNETFVNNSANSPQGSSMDNIQGSSTASGSAATHISHTTNDSKAAPVINSDGFTDNEQAFISGMPYYIYDQQGNLASNQPFIFNVGSQNGAQVGVQNKVPLGQNQPPASVNLGAQATNENQGNLNLGQASAHAGQQQTQANVGSQPTVNATDCSIGSQQAQMGFQGSNPSVLSSQSNSALFGFAQPNVNNLNNATFTIPAAQTYSQAARSPPKVPMQTNFSRNFNAALPNVVNGIYVSPPPQIAFASVPPSQTGNSNPIGSAGQTSGVQTGQSVPG